MGFNDREIREPIVLDIETAAHPCAAEFIERPDLDAIVAAKNLRDPDKIADDIRRRRAEAEDEYAQKLSRASLDFNLSRIVAIGYSLDGGETVQTSGCPDEDTERIALADFWDEAAGRLLIGFSIRTFDAPTLIQRSRLLNVPYRRLSFARYNNSSMTDLRDLLTFDDARYEALMPRSLKMFAKRFGLPVPDAITGADIAGLVAAEDWTSVLRHVEEDVKLTASLAKRVGVLSDVSAPAGIF